jgi:hypothetical protein
VLDLLLLPVLLLESVFLFGAVCLDRGRVLEEMALEKIALEEMPLKAVEEMLRQPADLERSKERDFDQSCLHYPCS